MSFDRSNLVPVPRDPAKLRKTALILLAIAFGGALIIIYFGYLPKIQEDEKSGRPPHVTRLESNFAAVRHDKQMVGLDSLKDKVWFLTTVCLAQKEKSAENVRVMMSIAEKYADREDLHYVCLTVDPENDEPEKMAEFAAELGLVDDKSWWFLAAGEEPTRGYIKDKLKYGSVSEVTEVGVTRVVFDSVLGIVDHNRNLRGRYKFPGALEEQEKTRRLLSEDPAAYEELDERQKGAIDQNLEAVQFLENGFFDALEYVINEKDGTLPEKP